jgi:hypothetical protein
MEAFESFVALALETEQLVVSEALKFPVQQQTTSGLQTHGYEVDLVGARSDRLVLATVKSYFGSTGVISQHVAGKAKNATHNKRYALLNNLVVRDAVVAGAAERFGYEAHQLEMRLTSATSPARAATMKIGSASGAPTSTWAGAPSRCSVCARSSTRSERSQPASSTATMPHWSP